MSTALEIKKTREFTPEQQRLIRAVVPGCQKLTEPEMQFYLHVAAENNLDPLMREIYALSIWDPDSQSMKLSIGIGLDGHRRRAAETGCYAPGKITFRYDEAGKLIAGTATVKVWHAESKVWIEVEGQELLLEECIQRKKDGTPSRFWKSTPRRQLGKCCEVDAIRRAFPRQTPRLAYHEEGEVILSAEDAYPEAIDSTAEEIDESAPVLSAPPPPAPPSDPPKKRGRPAGSTNKPAEVPPPVPVEAVAEPVRDATPQEVGRVSRANGAPLVVPIPEDAAPPPPARPGAPIDGIAERKRLLALADQMGIKSLMGGLRGGAGLDVDPSKWTPEGIARLERNMELEAVERGWKRPEPKPEEF